MWSAAVKTPGWHGYATKFSPFVPDRLACAASQNFGISGGGKVFFMQVIPDGEILIIGDGEWSNGLFDVAWSESNPDVAVTASGDGGLQLWDIHAPKTPVAFFKEHNKEAYSVHWNQTRSGDLFVSASWDMTVKLWDVHRSDSLSTFCGHEFVVYEAIWAPSLTGCFASVSGDRTLRVWDVQVPEATVVIPAHSSEILTCDWCKYNQNVLVTGATDGSIRGWDLRNTTSPAFELLGHRYAVKKVRFSPHEEHVIASCSYDTTTRLWNTMANKGREGEIVRHHTEFVYGLDFNNHIPGQISDCAWDATVQVFHPPIPGIKQLAVQM